MDPHQRLRHQIRAGRELLGMNQADFAEILNVSLAKVSRVESGQTKSGDILFEFKKTLERRGIRFTQTGVEVAEDTLEIIEGIDCYPRLLDDVLLTLKGYHNKELLIMFASDKVSPRIVNEKYRLLRRAGVKMRQLIEEGDTYIMGEFKEYRTIPSAYFVNVVTVVYGNKVAQVSGEEVRITINVNARLAERERRVFAYFWDNGKIPDVSTAIEKI